MPIFKRDAVWWVDIRDPKSGRRIRHSTEASDEQAAREYHDRLKADLWRQDKLGEKPRRSWDEAALKWLREREREGKRTVRDDAQKIAWFNPFFAGKWLDRLDRDAVMEVIEKKFEESGPATANRYLALVRAILRRAALEWGWLKHAPSFRQYKEAKRRLRYLTPAEAERLLAELPPHLRDLTKFALATGLRAGNITGLKWGEVDMQRRVAWVHADEAKAGHAIPVPLNELAMEVLVAQVGKHTEFVFTYLGSPIKNVSTKAWTKAKQRAGITNYRFHDNRHTWASWLRQRGVRLEDLQELGGWQTEAMVRRYAHIEADKHLRHATAKLDGILDGK